MSDVEWMEEYEFQAMAPIVSRIYSVLSLRPPSIRLNSSVVERGIAVHSNDHYPKVSGSTPLWDYNFCTFLPPVGAPSMADSSAA